MINNAQQSVYGQPGLPPGYGSYEGNPPPYAATSGITRATMVPAEAVIYVGSEPTVDKFPDFGFSDKSIRRAFIRKVYGILMVQLSISLGFIALFTFHDGTKKFVQKNLLLLYIALIVMFVCTIAMACCSNVRRKAPMNYIFLLVFTLAVSFMLGTVSSTFDVDEVLIAVGISAAVCLGLTLFAFQTKWDFTVMGGALFTALIILIIFGIIAIIIPGRILNMVYASCGALLFSLYLVYDTQLMIGGNHKYSISPEEYIFAALNLYLDVVNIFLFILAIIGGSRR